VAAEHGTLTDRGYLERVIASLGNRIFLLHDIHKPAPLLFQTRWALSFLRGPMTREQVAELMEPIKALAAAPPMAIPLCTWCHAELTESVGASCPSCGKMPWANAAFRNQDKAFREQLARAAGGPPSVPSTTSSSGSAHPPVLPPDINQFYLPITTRQTGMELEYRPMVLGFAEVTFVVDKRKGKEHVQPIHLLAEPVAIGHPLAWDKAVPVGERLEGSPSATGRWASVSDALDTGKKLKTLEKAFCEHLYSTLKLSLFENRALELISEVGESREAFQQRCRLAAQAEYKQALEMEQAKFRPKFEALDAVLPDVSPFAPQPAAPAPSGGGSWLGWLNPFGSSTPATSSTPLPGANNPDNPKVRKLTADYEAKKAELQKKWTRIGDEADPIQVKPRKTDVRVTHFGIGWVPVYLAGGKAITAWR
jgi:hypothetical protein